MSFCSLPTISIAFPPVKGSHRGALGSPSTSHEGHAVDSSRRPTRGFTHTPSGTFFGFAGRVGSKTRCGLNSVHALAVRVRVPISALLSVPNRQKQLAQSGS